MRMCYFVSEGFLLVACSPEVINLLLKLIKPACQISSPLTEWNRFACRGRKMTRLPLGLTNASLEKCENESTAASADQNGDF